ncbi:MAG: hypothetical protein WBA93_33395 [Microcoleaceae cyanobacterium]
MKEARKIKTILEAWFNYIDLDDYSKARVEADQKEIVKLLGNHMLIEEASDILKTSQINKTTTPTGK